MRGNTSYPFLLCSLFTIMIIIKPLNYVKKNVPDRAGMGHNEEFNGADSDIVCTVALDGYCSVIQSKPLNDNYFVGDYHTH